jgi:hypothetical protein
MNVRWFMRSPLWLLIAVALICVGADEPRLQPPAKLLPTVSAARHQAELLHETLHATLQAVHHQYYREDQGLPIPAAAMKDVFRHLERDRKVEARWLAVNAQAMNVNHEAKTDFEKAAVKALTAGEDAVEQIEDGVYRRVGPIMLESECLKCHLPTRKSNKARLAGLFIAIPVRAD